MPFERSTVIAYRVGKTVEIVNVFYGGRDYEALYRGHDESTGEYEQTLAKGATALMVLRYDSRRTHAP